MARWLSGRVCLWVVNGSRRLASRWVRGINKLWSFINGASGCAGMSFFLCFCNTGASVSAELVAAGLHPPPPPRGPDVSAVHVWLRRIFSEWFYFYPYVLFMRESSQASSTVCQSVHEIEMWRRALKFLLRCSCDQHVPALFLLLCAMRFTLVKKNLGNLSTAGWNFMLLSSDVQMNP